MAKNKKNTADSLKKKHIVFGSLIVFLLLVSWAIAIGARKIHFYKTVADNASAFQVRELIVHAVEGLKKPAPVEPRTGDIYFPESKLFLPNPSDNRQLTYAFYKDEGTAPDGELSVSFTRVPGYDRVYSAQNVVQVFEAVPKLQACSRGVRILYQESTEEQLSLKHTVKLDNGKTLYLYSEDACGELDELADKLAGIKAY